MNEIRTVLLELSLTLRESHVRNQAAQVTVASPFERNPTIDCLYCGKTGWSDLTKPNEWKVMQ